MEEKRDVEIPVCEWLRAKFLYGWTINVDEVHKHAGECELCRKLFNL